MTQWLTDEEAQGYIDSHSYRLPGATVYGLAAKGELKALLDSATED